jgi:hypothetical protein
MDVSLGLSIVSLVISGITFIFTFPKIRRESKGRLAIKAFLTESKSQIEVVVTTESFGRVVIITGIEVYYGSMPAYKQLVQQIPYEPVELNEAKQKSFFINIQDLKDGAIRNRVIQRYYSLLWIRVITTLSAGPLKKVNLPDKYFANTTDYNAEKYMATDDLLGFSLMKPVKRLENPRSKISNK